MKFESGFEQVLRLAVVISKYVCVINSYLQFEKEIYFQSLSLWCVFQAIKSSKKKSVTWSDDKTAKFMNGFDTLQDFAKKIIQSSNLRPGLEKRKRYNLKLDTKLLVWMKHEKFHHIVLILLCPTQGKIHSSVLKVNKLVPSSSGVFGISPKYSKHSRYS